MKAGYPNHRRPKQHHTITTRQLPLKGCSITGRYSTANSIFACNAKFIFVHEQTTDNGAGFCHWMREAMVQAAYDAGGIIHQLVPPIPLGFALSGVDHRP